MTDLMSRIEAAVAECARWHYERGVGVVGAADHCIEADAALLALIAEVVKDAERYQYLRHSPIYAGLPAIHLRVYDGYHIALTNEEADAAVDAARAKEVGSE